MIKCKEERGRGDKKERGLRFRREDIIKMNLRGKRWDVMDLAQVRDQLRALVDTVMNVKCFLAQVSDWQLLKKHLAPWN
jgi:hypothetical protein